MDYKDKTSDVPAVCSSVRRFFFPQTAYIIIGVLSAFVVLINSLAMISVLKNYRRLRQRIYVFVINLAVVEILAGIIFFSDVMTRFFQHRDVTEYGDAINDVIFTTSTGEDTKYIRLQANSNELSHEFFEALKSAVVVLSVLNIALVTFALYKRTTSMGRHHEDFKTMNAGLTSDGNSFLPAFDTMLRVLSIGSPMESYNVKRNFGPRGSQSSFSARNGDSPVRREGSTSSRNSNSSPQHGSMEHNNAKDPGLTLLEKQKEQQNAGVRVNTPIVRNPVDNKGRKTSGQVKYDPSKRNTSITRLMSTGRRVSHAIRSRSSSGSQAYVGRHSYSVMSKRSSACSLIGIWFLFILMCFLPMAMRRSGLVNIICPDACGSVEITELAKTEGSTDRVTHFDSYPIGSSTPHISQIEEITSNASTRKMNPEPMVNWMTTTGTMIVGERKRDVNHFVDVKEQPIKEVKRQSREENTIALLNEEEDENGKDSKHEEEDDRMNKNVKSLLDDIQANTEHPILLPDVDVTNIGSCAPSGYHYYSFSRSNSLIGAKKDRNLTGTNWSGLVEYTSEFSYSQVVSYTSTSQQACMSCSTAFFPLSKSQMIFNALLILITWVWLLISASRLLYLRKHSTNVFVRCSALWRFMFLTSIFFMVTLAPYVVWIVLDFTTASPAYKSRLWYSEPASINSHISDNTKRGDIYESGGTPLDIAPVSTSASPGRISQFSPVSSDVEYLNQLYGVISTILLLLNFAIAPTLYLVRLLGFRRIISAL